MAASDNTRVWPAAVAALSGSSLVGVMPLLARQLYADGLSAPSMLLWRYDLAILALAGAALVMKIDLRRVLRSGGWRIVLLGATLGAAQTLCFWESLKTLETSIAVLLFYTYPAVTLALDRLILKQPIRPVAVLCIAMILGGAALITLPGLRGGTIDLRGLFWAMPSPLVYSLYLAINSRLLRHYPPLVGAGGLFLGMAITFTAMAPFVGLDMPTHAATWLLVLLIALGPGALTMTLFSYSVPKLGATGFAILANAELVTVVLIGTLVLGEAMTPDRAIGGAVIVAGIVTHALSRRAAPRPPRYARHPLPASRGEGREGAGITSLKKIIPALKTSLILHAPCSQRGAIMRRLDGGAGRRRDRRTGPQSGSRRPAIPGLVLVRRPRAWFAATHPGGVGAPPGDTTIPCREPADGGA
jgi:drug/metabolite transporter (DMT)-like permease